MKMTQISILHLGQQHLNLDLQTSPQHYKMDQVTLINNNQFRYLNQHFQLINQV